MQTRLSLISSIVISLALPSVSQTQRGRVIETGQFYCYEMRATTGERWLGLFVSERWSGLRYLTIIVTKVFDDITDDTPDQKTGKRVSVNSSSQPLLLVRHITALAPGPVRTTFKMKEGEYSYGLDQFPLTLRLGHRSYVLKLLHLIRMLNRAPILISPGTLDWY